MSEDTKPAARPIAKPIGLRRGRYAILMAIWFVIAWPLLHWIEFPDGFGYLGMLAVFFPAMLLTASRLLNMGSGWGWALLMFTFPAMFILPIICMAVPEGTGQNKESILPVCFLFLAIPSLLLNIPLITYPGSILRGNLASVTISRRSEFGGPLTVHSPKDLNDLQNALNHVTKPLVSFWQEMEGPDHFTLQITYTNGETETFYSDGFEFVGGARAPRNFRAELDKLFLEARKSGR